MFWFPPPYICPRNKSESTYLCKSLLSWRDLGIHFACTKKTVRLTGLDAVENCHFYVWPLLDLHLLMKQFSQRCSSSFHTELEGKWTTNLVASTVTIRINMLDFVSILNFKSRHFNFECVQVTRASLWVTLISNGWLSFPIFCQERQVCSFIRIKIVASTSACLKGEEMEKEVVSQDPSACWR